MLGLFRLLVLMTVVSLPRGSRPLLLRDLLSPMTLASQHSYVVQHKGAKSDNYIFGVDLFCGVGFARFASIAAQSQLRNFDTFLAKAVLSIKVR